MNCVFLVIPLLAAVSGDVTMRECGRLFDPESLGCCSRKAPPDFNKVPEDLKDCFELKMKHDSCVFDECIAKKRGYYSEGGIIEEALQSSVQERFKTDPEVLARIEKYCVKADLSKFGRHDTCDFTKLRHCIDLQILTKCTEWNDKDDCAGMREVVEECIPKE